jgi:hypothetical protein
MSAIVTEMFSILLQYFTQHVSAPTGHLQVDDRCCAEACCVKDCNNIENSSVAIADIYEKL